MSDRIDSKGRKVPIEYVDLPDEVLRELEYRNGTHFGTTRLERKKRAYERYQLKKRFKLVASAGAREGEEG